MQWLSLYISTSFLFKMYFLKIKIYTLTLGDHMNLNAFETVQKAAGALKEPRGYHWQSRVALLGIYYTDVNLQLKFFGITVHTIHKHATGLCSHSMFSPMPSLLVCMYLSKCLLVIIHIWILFSNSVS